MTTTCPRCWGRIAACALCRGTGRIPDQRLSPNFRLSELAASATARDAGIPNDPSPEVLANLRMLCEDTLEPMRKAAGCALVVTSGYRSPKLNAAVGGAASSAHVLGLAADVQPATGTLRDLTARTLGSGAIYDQIILEPSWIHVGRKSPTGVVRGERLMLLKRGGKYERLDLNDPRVLAMNA